MNDAIDSQPLEVAGDYDGSLFGPELLNPAEASRLLSRGPGRLVVWIGERGAGKTTLSAELYERQRHAASDASFAGSWTLLALEQIAHQRRATGAPLPAARDTLDGEGREILHLALSTGGAPLHLLLADLPGEVFRRLADCQLAVSEIPWLRRADKLVLLVDGERLRDTAVRSSTLTRVRQLLERLQSSELPGPDTRLALLVTKWDLVREDPDVLAYWAARETELMADLRGLDPQAVALHASAHANGHDGDGLATLRAWLLEVGLPTTLPPQFHGARSAPAVGAGTASMPTPLAAASASADPSPPTPGVSTAPALAERSFPAAVPSAPALEDLSWPLVEQRRRWLPWRWRR